MEKRHRVATIVVLGLLITLLVLLLGLTPAAQGIRGPAAGELPLPAGAAPAEAVGSYARARAVMAYYTGKEGYLPSSQAGLEENGNQITYVAPFRYRLEPSGSGKLVVTGVPEQDMKQMMSTARQQNIKVLALVHNLMYGNSADGPKVAHRVLSDPNKRWALVMNIFNIIKENGFHGVEIDIENIYPRDKNLFNQFMAELSSQLHPAGYYISVALPARISDTPNKSWADSFDYATVGRHANQVVIMAYDEHGYSSGPGAIASVNWVEKIIKYTLTRIPADKVLLGVPAYGFDWNRDRPLPRYISYALAMKTSRQYGSKISWSDTAQAPYFTYTDENGSRHSVWFENASSWAAKLDLVNKYDLAGIALWRLGMEDPYSWQLIRDKFKVKKK